MKPKTHQQAYDRLGTLDLESFLNHLLLETPIPFKGHLIRCGSPRIRTFLKGISCAFCGIQATISAIERTADGLKSSSYHVNLYHVREDGTEVMMTSDHIHPKSKGGREDLFNRQPMCIICNLKKGSKILHTNPNAIQPDT